MYFLMSLEKKNKPEDLSYPTPQLYQGKGERNPKCTNIEAQWLRACTWEPDRSTITILPLNNLFHLNQISLPLSIKWQ